MIFDREVAKEYLRILKIIGMEVGLHKSILSSRQETLAVEFAKRVFLNGEDVSPVPILEFTSSLFDYGRLIEFARKYSLTAIQLAKVLGFKYQALSKLQSARFSDLNYKLKMLLISMEIPTTEEGATSLFELGSPIRANVRVDVEKIVKTFTQQEVNALLRKIDRLEKSHREGMGPFWNLYGNLIARLSSPPKTEKVQAEGWFGHVRDELTVLIEPYDSHRWSEVNNYRSPSELKELGKAWLVKTTSPGDAIFQPNVYLGLESLVDDLKDRRKRAVDTTRLPEKDIRWALACLLDLLVLPPRQDLMDLFREVQATLLDPRAELPTIASAVVRLIENSREVALIPTVMAELVRHAPTSSPKTSIGAKLWKRWTPVIQGSISVDQFISSKKT